MTLSAVTVLLLLCHCSMGSSRLSLTPTAVSCSTIFSSSGKFLTAHSVATCAMACALDTNCGGFHVQQQLLASNSEASATALTCHLASVCQMHYWLYEFKHLDGGDICQVYTITARDKFQQLRSGLSNDLAESTAVFADFRGAAANVNHRNVCQTVGSFVNVQPVPSGLKLFGSVASYVDVDASLFSFFNLGDTSQLSVFMKITRFKMDAMVHYLWFSECGSSDGFIVFREYHDSLSLLFRSSSRYIDWQLRPIPSDIFSSSLVSIGFTTNGTSARLYFNGLIASGTVSTNISNALKTPSSACMYVGRTPNNSQRSVNGTMHCLHLVRRVVTDEEMRLMEQFCSSADHTSSDHQCG